MVKSQKTGTKKEVKKGIEYPFAKARVERILQKYCPDAEVSPRVRLAFNKWLGEMAENVSHELAKVSHKTITEEDFRNIISRYDFAGDLKKERERISRKMKELDKEVGKFKELVEKSIIHREEGPQDLIFGRVTDQYKQDYEEAVYVSEAPVPEPEAEVKAEPVEAEPAETEK